jgi:hypothetical protein
VAGHRATDPGALLHHRIGEEVGLGRGRAVVLVGEEHDGEVGVGAQEAGVPDGGRVQGPGQRGQLVLEAAADQAQIGQAIEGQRQRPLLRAPGQAGEAHAVGEAAAGPGAQHARIAPGLAPGVLQPRGHARAEIAGDHPHVQVRRSSRHRRQLEQKRRELAAQLHLPDIGRGVVDHEEEVELRRGLDGEGHPARRRWRRRLPASGEGDGQKGDAHVAIISQATKQFHGAPSPERLRRGGLSPPGERRGS